MCEVLFPGEDLGYLGKNEKAEDDGFNQYCGANGVGRMKRIAAQATT